jgi:uncharacterized protein (TIGR02271 family)
LTTQPQDYAAWIGHQVVDSAGEKVGKVSEIFVDDETGRPEWLAISTGMFAKRSSFVPLQGASADGDQLVIEYDKDKVKDAPQVDDDGDGHLTPAEEQELYRYYDRQMTTSTVAAENGTVAAENGTVAPEAGTVGYDTSGPTTDDAMTRSEEQVRVGTRTQESGRARLRKYVVTEMVTQTVPVSHEEVRIEREPITDANRGAATDGPAISEEEHEVVLHEEQPVVEKEVVPVERVRLATETVTNEQTVNTEVRKEQIEQEGVETADQRNL